METQEQRREKLRQIALVRAKIEGACRLVMPTMCRLAERWEDERGHERLAEYKIVLEAELPKDFTIVEMVASPFGFRFRILDDSYVYGMEVDVPGEVRFWRVG